MTLYKRTHLNWTSASTVKEIYMHIQKILIDEIDVDIVSNMLSLSVTNEMVLCTSKFVSLASSRQGILHYFFRCQKIHHILNCMTICENFIWKVLCHHRALDAIYLH